LIGVRVHGPDRGSSVNGFATSGAHLGLQEQPAPAVRAAAR
jgi:hypothetical protein